MLLKTSFGCRWQYNVGVEYHRIVGCQEERCNMCVSENFIRNSTSDNINIIAWLITIYVFCLLIFVFFTLSKALIRQ